MVKGGAAIAGEDTTLELSEEDMNAIVCALAHMTHILRLTVYEPHWRKLSDFYYGLPIPLNGAVKFTLTYEEAQS